MKRFAVLVAVVLLPASIILALGFSGGHVYRYAQLSSTAYPNTWMLTLGGSEDDYPWWGIEVNEQGYVYTIGQSSSWRPLGYVPLVVVKASRYGENAGTIAVYGNGSFMGRDLAIVGKTIYAVGQVTGYGAGGTDAYLTAFLENGTVKFFTTVGSSALDLFWRISVGRDNAIYAVGYTMGLGAVKADVLITKFDSDGKVLWNLVAGESQYDYGWGIVTWYNSTSGREYVIVSGQTNSFTVGGGYDCLVLKLTSEGMLEWSIVFGTPELDRLEEVVVDEHGFIYVAGATYSAGIPDVLVAKISPEGELVWIKSFGGERGDAAYSIYVDNDYVYVAGYTESYTSGELGRHDAFVALLNKDTGEVTSFIHFGGSEVEIAYGVKSDVNYVYVSGYTASFTEGGRDFFIAKLNKQYLLEDDPSDLLWVYRDFPEEVNVSRIDLRSITPSMNFSSVYIRASYVSPVVNNYELLGYLVMPLTHLATTTGNPPAELTTVTVTQTTTETMIATRTTTRTTTLTETRTTTETEVLTFNNTVTETTVATTTRIVTETLEATSVVTSIIRDTLTYTTTEVQRSTVTKTEAVTRTLLDVNTTMALGAAMLIIGLVVGHFVLRQISKR
ncbi:MAG: hypothetical protein QW369_02420 [Desulfurococcaceae archaeon]